jgi:hypothetical protein
MKYDICCIGNITMYQVVTAKETVYMQGGKPACCGNGNIED